MSRLEQEVKIRDARDEERDQIANVMLEAYRQYAFDMPHERWEEYQENIRSSVYGNGPHARLVAELGGDIVGSLQLFLTSEAAYGRSDLGIDSPIIRLLAVSPYARRRGIAKLLLREAARRSLQLGARTLYLHTSDMMAAAVKLYESLGFERAYEADTSNGATLVKSYKIQLTDALPLLQTT